MRVRQYQAKLVRLSKSLRKNQSDAEKLLWYRLRNRQIQNLKFQRQFILGTYIVDFVCQEYKLIIEVDGGQHNNENTIVYDTKRTQYLQNLGYNVLRFWNNDVLTNVDEVIKCIIDTIELSS